jgi:hypothetical protein
MGAGYTLGSHCDWFKGTFFENYVLKLRKRAAKLTTESVTISLLWKCLGPPSLNCAVGEVDFWIFWIFYFLQFAIDGENKTKVEKVKSQKNKFFCSNFRTELDTKIKSTILKSA